MPHSSDDRICRLLARQAAAGCRLVTQVDQIDALVKRDEEKERDGQGTGMRRGTSETIPAMHPAGVIATACV